MVLLQVCTEINESASKFLLNRGNFNQLENDEIGIWYAYACWTEPRVR